MTEKDIAEMALRIVMALIEAGPYKAAEYPQFLKIYEAVSKQIAKSVLEARKILDGEMPETEEQLNQLRKDS